MWLWKILKRAIRESKENMFAPEIYENPNIFQAESNVIEYDKAGNLTISLRCPHCSHIGSFPYVARWVGFSKPLKHMSKTRHGGISAGIRQCPNPVCQGIVFTVIHTNGMGEGGTIVLPPELIDFDANSLPTNLLATLKEAISCHAAGAYRASAMMVRRLLEEICDESGAQGKDLHARLIELKTKITLPEELFDAMGELKALGNDAAHITAKNYTSIGKDESEDSIELAKEILKARYQLKGLVDRLRARRGNAGP
jgi:Domain of unknown function (DUF4145)